MGLLARHQSQEDILEAWPQPLETRDVDAARCEDPQDLRPSA